MLDSQYRERPGSNSLCCSFKAWKTTTNFMNFFELVKRQFLDNSDAADIVRGSGDDIDLEI